MSKLKIDRITSRLNNELQEKVSFLLGNGYSQAEIIKLGLELLYDKVLANKKPSIPGLLKSLFAEKGIGPEDLSTNYKEHYKDLMLEKYNR